MVGPCWLASVCCVDAREDDHGDGGDAFAQDGQRLVVSDAGGELGDAVRGHGRTDENIALGVRLGLVRQPWRRSDGQAGQGLQLLDFAQVVEPQGGGRR